jgi:hypothetical protein
MANAERLGRPKRMLAPGLANDSRVRDAAEASGARRRGLICIKLRRRQVR